MATLTKNEKDMINNAMGFGLGQDHWFKCPNDHIYCIADCGNAAEISICPECKAKIGGAGHILLISNQRAKEMDATQFYY